MRRQVLSAAAPACLLIGLTPLAAAADVAPPGNATATAAQVSNLATISKTAAQADQSKSQAQAAAINIGGEPVKGTGGTQAGEGESGGALVDTAAALPARVQVAPWKATAKGSENSAKRSSHGSAALARVDVPETAKLGVLTSDASAEHSNGKSTGQSTSDAVDLSLGDTTRIVLLHSEVDSNAKGHSYLVNLSGTEIGTDDQLGKSCALNASVAQLACLTVSGGVANGVTSGEAEVLGVQTALGLNPVSAFAATGTSAAGSIPPILQSVAPAVPSVEAPRAAAAVTPPSAALPRTGVAAGSMAASALAALLVGLGLRRYGRRHSLAG